ncbi:MAG: serine/threonine-protein kinase [Deltaproteobacteria bacterium]|nr:serine/threonine-protein kinase [Deltaproteobacteria bacterium]
MYPDFNPNEKIYSDLKLVAKGAVGEVYSAINQKLNIKVALKRLQPQFLYDQAEVNKIKAEAKILTKLNHPHCVKLMSTYFSETEILLELEWIEGGSLESHLKSSPFLEIEARNWIQQLMDIVKDLQQNQIIHGDLQPKNILLQQEKAMLIDFSSSVEMCPDQDYYPFHGTPRAYQMKLQNAQKQIHRYHDYQTLGLLFYEMLTGKKIFNSPNSLTHFIETWNFNADSFLKHFHFSQESGELLRALITCTQTGQHPVYR